VNIEFGAFILQNKTTDYINNHEFVYLFRWNYSRRYKH